MDVLNAYWRMEYVAAPDEQKEERGHLFRDLPKRDDRDALIVERGKTIYLVLNRYPYNPGHLLVIPFREVAALADLDEAERAEFMTMLIRGQELLQKALRPDGFNIGLNLGSRAGAGIPQHLHAHIVPRWEGDTNFMPVIGKTRVLPEALEATWAKLREVR